MEQYYSVLRNCALFRSIGDKEFGHLMECIGSQVKQYEADSYIFLAGDVVNHVGIVLSGAVEVMKESLAGNKHIVAILGPADMFAEGIVCTVKRISPVTVRVKEDAKILVIPYERIIRSCGRSCNFHISLIENMMVVLGEKNVNLNRKLELIALKGMREKIASFLIGESNRRNSNMFQVPFNRTELADYLNVSRTSMCRELTRMKDEGLIDFYGSSFKLTNKEELARCLE